MKNPEKWVGRNEISSSRFHFSCDGIPVTTHFLHLCSMVTDRLRKPLRGYTQSASTSLAASQLSIQSLPTFKNLANS